MSTQKRQANPLVRPVGKAGVKTKEGYNLAMKDIDSLMKKGEKKLSAKDQSRLRSLAIAAEQYEDTNDPLPPPELVLS